MKIVKKLVLSIASAAMAMALVPTAGFADGVTTYGSSSAPDDMIGIVWTDDAGSSHTATVDLNALEKKTDTIGALYNKKGVWTVVGSDEYVTLSAILEAAQDDGVSALESWGAGKSLSFNAWNEESDGSWSCSNYTKYKYFTYENITASTDFYGDTTSSDLGTTGTAMYSDMCIALNCGQQAVGTTAASTLASMTMDASDAPRAMWGYLNSSNVGGNRFPCNIDCITIS